MDEQTQVRLAPRSRTMPEYVEVRVPAVPPPAPSSEVARHLSQQARDLRDYWIAEMRARMQELNGMPSEYGAGAMPLWDGVVEEGTRNRFGNKQKSRPPVWEELLERCRNHAVNPYRFLRHAAGCWTGGSPPIPNFLLCTEAFQLYCNAPREEEQARISLGIQQNHARVQFSELSRDISFSSDTARWRTILLDLRPPLTSLFCYCLARQLGLWREAEQRLAGAARQYLLDRELYDTVWGDYLPANLTAQTNEQLFQTAGGAL